MDVSSVSLPPEIWTRVLFWATFNPARESDSLLKIPAFDSADSSKQCRMCDEALITKRNVSLVCSEWNLLSKRFMYEDLRVRHNSWLLADLLETSGSYSYHTLGYGAYVKRIAVIDNPLTGSSSRWAGKDLRRIIRCCPNLVVLSRYHNSNKVYDDHLEKYTSSPEVEEEYFDENDIDLSHIRRIDWDNGTPKNYQRTISTPPRIAWFSSTLEVLSLGGDNYFWPPSELQGLSSLTLPKVHTLRVGSLYAFGIPGVHTYNLILPSLTRVILDRAEALYRLISCCLRISLQFGAQVRHVEVGSAHSRFTRGDYITQLLEVCPAVETLYYPIFYTRPLNWRVRPLGPREPRGHGQLRMMHDGDRRRDVANRFTSPYTLFKHLRRIGWHGERNSEFSLMDMYQNSTLELKLNNYNNTNDNNKSLEAETWIHLINQLRTILNSFTSMQELELCGGSRLWVSLIDDPRFFQLLSGAQSRGVVFCSEDKEVALKLEETKFNFGTELMLLWISELTTTMTTTMTSEDPRYK